MLTPTLPQHIPLGLGGLPRLSCLLISPGSPPHPSPLLPHLRSCHFKASGGRPSSPRPPSLPYPRQRGAVFDSKILNSGSAQSLFTQMQAQAVQTGNRLLTPLIPPLGRCSPCPPSSPPPPALCWTLTSCETPSSVSSTALCWATPWGCSPWAWLRRSVPSTTARGWL